MTFSAMDRELNRDLIAEVQARPVLWDSRLEEYRDRERKFSLWIEVADKLGTTAGWRDRFIMVQAYAAVVAVYVYAQS